MAPTKKSILVVDDEQDTLTLLRVILEIEGFTMWEAVNGNEALKQVQKMPDLILLDVRMPGRLSGLEVCQRLKKDPHYKHIPIFLFSVLALDRDKELGLKAGANEYLTKPFVSEKLIQLIKKYI